jgi:hypothetical protein
MALCICGRCSALGRRGPGRGGPLLLHLLIQWRCTPALSLGPRGNHPPHPGKLRRPGTPSDRQRGTLSAGERAGVRGNWAHLVSTASTLSLTPPTNGRRIILVLPTPSRFNPPVSVIGLNGCRLGSPSLISMIVFNKNSQVGLHNPLQILSFAKVNRARSHAHTLSQYHC